MPPPDGFTDLSPPGLIPVRDARAPIRCLIASLAPGGAERIVLEWLAAEARLGRDVELAVIHRRATALRAPLGARVVFRDTERPGEFVARLADRWRDSPAPVAAHLVPDDLIKRLGEAGLRVVPVVHNVREGWRNNPARWAPPAVPLAVACAGQVRVQMQEAGCRVPVVTVRHRPRVGARATDAEIRRTLRAEWGVNDSTLLVGMVGALKAQKHYARAVQVLAQLAKRREAVLVIVGGLLDRAALGELDRLFETALALGVQQRIRLPGFTADIEPWLAAFDVLLNTSGHEGLSIAVQEALGAGLPVVATDVGGQREICHPALTLVPASTPPDVIAGLLAVVPVRSRLDAHPLPRAPRLWSLTLTHRAVAGEKLATLFVTANLNAGGAQRSLANLVTHLARQHRCAVAVCGECAPRAFAGQLVDAGVELFRTTVLRDDLAHAESLLAQAAMRGVRNLVFWNVAPGVKLAVQCFAPPGLRVIDVSPGGYAFEELDRARDFADALGTSAAEYIAGLHALVLKWKDPSPPAAAALRVIPNGVAARATMNRMPDHPRFLVSGRIAPSKRLETVFVAFQLFAANVPRAELHVFGAADGREHVYAESLRANAGHGVRFRGACFDGAYFAEPWSAAVVLGTQQGCPNAVLEAMAAGVPVIANDSGGTRELVEPSGGGWLLPEAVDATQLSSAMHQAWRDATEAARRGAAARTWVAAHRSIDAMTASYLELLTD